jgi:NTP pyrophosphatase (non-canonical NTP hydrolase)
MPALINDPEAHRPHGPKFGHPGLWADEVKLTAGFYEPASEEQQKLKDTLPAEAQVAESFILPIDDYQAWCELSWKEPHGTENSSDRSADKLMEETRELFEQLSMPEHRHTDEAIVSELGDVLWCTTAIASDLGINVKHALMDLMNQYGHHFIREDGSIPEWVKRAQTFTFDKKLTSRSLDQLVDDGFRSDEAAIMWIDYDDETKSISYPEIADAANHIDFNSRLLVSIAGMNYEKNTYQTGAIQRRDDAGYLIARIYTDVAFLARYTAGSTINEVIRENVLKISNRVENNLVDKSDGSRE